MMKSKVAALLAGALWLSSAAAASESSGTQRELDWTPTWAMAFICAVIVIISNLLEMSLHKLGSFLDNQNKRDLFEALEKVKAELMIVGFISLLLAFGQSYFTKISIPSKAADTMLPCKLPPNRTDTSGDDDQEEHDGRRSSSHHRFFASTDSSSKCKTGYDIVCERWCT